MISKLERQSQGIPTLFLVTQPLPMFAGNYRVRKITADAAARLIREYFDRNDRQVISGVHAGTTAGLLTHMTGRVVKRYMQPRLPPPEPGDQFLYVRLASGIIRESGAQRLGVPDVEFLLIDFTEE